MPAQPASGVTHGVQRGTTDRSIVHSAPNNCRRPACLLAPVCVCVCVCVCARARACLCAYRGSAKVKNGTGVIREGRYPPLSQFFLHLSVCCVHATCLQRVYFSLSVPTCCFNVYLSRRVGFQDNEDRDYHLFVSSLSVNTVQTELVCRGSGYAFQVVLKIKASYADALVQAGSDLRIVVQRACE